MNRAPRYACNYAVLRFLPYPETGEFVNLGLVVHSSELRQVALKITTRTQRVTDFFPELNRESFAEARHAMKEELDRMSRLIAAEKSPEKGRLLFRALVKPRESVFRFGEMRTALADSLDDIARSLFEQHVHRQFLQTPAYQEPLMARRYVKALRERFAHRKFRTEAIVGTDEYRVRIPITSAFQNSNETPNLAVKPLDLNRAEPTAIIEHGDAWLQRLRRLAAIRHRPQQFIFPIQYPVEQRCREAALKVQADLIGEGGTVIEADDTDQLLRLASVELG